MTIASSEIDEREVDTPSAPVVEADCDATGGGGASEPAQYQAYGNYASRGRDREAYKAFMAIDRDQEDLMVCEYKRTKDQALVTKLYEIREPTMRVWARTYAYYGDSEEDLFAELRTVWLKCLDQYEYEARMRKVRTKGGGYVFDKDGKVKVRLKRTSFNTFLYTSLRNYVWNITKKHYSKKRTDDDGVPFKSKFVSLDSDPSGDGDGRLLHETIPDETQQAPCGLIDAEWLIDTVSCGDKAVEKALREYAGERHVRELMTVCRMRTGNLPLCKADRAMLFSGGRDAVKRLRGMIVESRKHAGTFKIAGYQVYPKKVSYDIYTNDDTLWNKVQLALAKAKAILASSMHRDSGADGLDQQ